ncbi:MAG: hypothetical protein LBT68_03745 [Spirochaetales bacterium]|jgi:predicted xylose isomerase-like sugar epimerase|nr:hypothetical protein [Spirochaetales bacterium]
MSKLTDFYKTAGTDKELGKQLLQLRQNFDSGKIDKEKAITEITALAKKRGVELARADFDEKISEVDDAALTAIAGGHCAGNIEVCSGNIAMSAKGC